MNRLQAIIYKYTQILVPPVEHIFDNSLEIINDSILILYPPRSTLVNIYVENISLDLTHKKIIATIFVDNSDIFFEDKSIFGINIMSNKDTCINIINDYYNQQPDKILAVTGSFGKSSAVIFLYELLILMGQKTTMVSTLNMKGLSLKYLPLQRNTTPSWISLKRILHESRHNAVVVLEVSSHAIGKEIEDSRLFNIKFDGGLWTGFTVDHLEYHGTVENYFETKRKFIASLPITIVHENVLSFQELKFVPTYIYGKKINKITDHGFIFQNLVYNQDFSVKFFQQENLLGAMILLFFLGYTNVFDYIKNTYEVPGRMEYFGQTLRGADVFADCAYRMQNIIEILDFFNKVNLKRIILVMGAGGDRDRGDNYRKNIGLLSDKVKILIITDDNPRGEDPKKIREEIIQQNNFLWEIGCRLDAMNVAFNIATKDDIVLILGRGSEEKIQYNNNYAFMSDKDMFLHYKFHHSL
jgi:UDP-N-acetylmuramoyl-L-alanyl-D-glutamate--2,6-diaminopimelate ligase